jgi:hypothetical protein
MSGRIQTAIEDIKKKYSITARDIFADYKRENEYKNEYENRQLYELLQNADDASELETREEKVYIELDGNKLIISNTGEPFSEEGIESLMYSNTSPKSMQKKKIGQKGLGFRAMLNWANRLQIVTSSFCVDFDKQHAIKEYNKIKAAYPEIDKKMKSLTQDESPVAILCFPQLNAEHDRGLKSGYVTTITFFCSDIHLETIKEQLETFSFEELIFLRHLKEIEIKTKDSHKKIKAIEEDNEIIIRQHNLIYKENCKETYWKLFEDFGNIEIENEVKEYEFVIAYSNEPNIQGHQREKGVLYSFFKTHIPMRFPFLLHATLDLIGNRNEMQEGSKYNKILIEKLADFIGETATKLSKESVNYDPLKMLVSANTYDKVLDGVFGFSSKINKLIESLEVYPAITNKYVSLNKAKYSQKGYNQIVKATTFDSLLQSCDDPYIEKYLREKISFYSADEFIRKIEADADIYSTDEKIAIISLYIEQYQNPQCAPKLLLDSDGARISEDIKIFCTPGDLEKFALPEWSEIKFINGEMEKKLRDKFNFTKRELASKLKTFNLEEYSFEQLLTPLAKKAKENREYNIDFIHWLFEFYCKNENSFPSDILKSDIQLITKDKKTASSGNLYFGIEYKNDLLEKLSSPNNNIDYLVEPSVYNLEGDNKLIIRFFEELGVSLYPKIAVQNLTSLDRSNYGDYNSLIYPELMPCYYSGEKYTFYEIMKQSLEKVCVDSIDGINEILDKSPTEIILAWVMNDEKVKRLLTSENEVSDSSCIIGTPSYKQDTRKVNKTQMRSYLKMVFEKTAWIQTNNGKKPPNQCVLTGDKLDKTINIADIDYEYLKNNYEINRYNVEALLQNLGAVSNFTELPKEMIYTILLHLPSTDKYCKKGASLYDKLNKAYKDQKLEELVKDNKAYNEFLKKGRLLADKEGKLGYYPVADVLYIDKRIICEQILNKYAILKLAPRAGVDKVKKLFGAIPFKDIDDKIDINHGEHSLHKEFESDYQKLLPYFYATRIDDDNSNVNFNAIRRTKIILCDNVKQQYDNETYLLKDFELNYLQSKDIAYFKIPETIDYLKDLKENTKYKDGISEIICAIFDVGANKSIYREIAGCKSLEDIRFIMGRDSGDEVNENIEKSKRKFFSPQSMEQEFCETIGKITGGNIENIKKTICAYKINFKDSDGTQFLEAIEKAFIEFKVDLTTFNETASIGVFIDFTEYYKNKFNELKSSLRERYLSYIYKHNNKEEFKKKKEDYDIGETEFSNKIININDKFLERYEVSVETISGFEVCDYNYSDDLTESSNGTGGDMLGSESSSQDEPINYREIFENINSTNIGITDTGIEKSDLSGKGRSGHNGGSKTYHSSERKKKENGYIGEVAVYKKLQELYGSKGYSVLWVSGYAELAGEISKGDDTKGYDFEYYDGTSKRYVEVKTITSDAVDFYITINELTIAKKNRDTYDVYIVKISNSQVDHIYNVKSIFAFKDGEDVFNNSKFSIREDSFLIKAKLSDKSDFELP